MPSREKEETKNILAKAHGFWERAFLEIFDRAIALAKQEEDHD